MEMKLPHRGTGWAFWPWVLLGGLLALDSLSGASYSGYSRSDFPLTRESVFAAAFQASAGTELERLQKQNGLTIGIFNYQGTGLNLFKKHQFVFLEHAFDGNGVTGAVSRDGTEVAVSQLMSKPSTVVVMRPDGSGLREYAGIRANSQICWSYDNSKLVLGTAGPKLLLLELKSGLVQELPITDLSHGQIVASQCWSPDGKQIVYESSDGNAFVYDFGKRNSTKLAKGTEPTWSPDENWIAYRDSDTYYAIHPSGEGQKKIFQKTRAVSGLYWSPDSRFVVYVHQDSFALDTEFYHLMVRRLEDNSETSVADGEDAGAGYNYQWVINKELVAQIESATRSK
jgi:Tol biopolymer transport system component